MTKRWKVTVTVEDDILDRLRDLHWQPQPALPGR
jgi:hypothetical protein